jgi:hypothetical protein
LAIACQRICSGNDTHSEPGLRRRRRLWPDHGPKPSLMCLSKSGRDPSLPATVCEQRWVSGQELVFDAQRVTTIGFSEARATHNSWRSVTMNDSMTRELANDPQDLERLLVARENAGDVAGMTALFEPDAVVDIWRWNVPARQRGHSRVFY